MTSPTIAHSPTAQCALHSIAQKCAMLFVRQQWTNSLLLSITHAKQPTLVAYCSPATDHHQKMVVGHFAVEATNAFEAKMATSKPTATPRALSTKVAQVDYTFLKCNV